MNGDSSALDRTLARVGRQSEVKRGDMNLHSMVFGPAYLDRVLRVDRPLIGPAVGSESPIDQSVEGSLEFAGGSNLEVADPSGYSIEIALPPGWPGPSGRIQLKQGLRAGATGRRAVNGLGWSDDLGGMGAGYAAALGGTLCCALGPENDPISQVIARFLHRRAIVHTTIRVADHGADWTLLVSSGMHGDKLPIGFRGCHAALDPESVDAWLSTPCDLRVAAALPNRLAARILSAPGAGCRVFAPAMRNMRDQEYLVSSFAGSIDLLCCNRQEWETLADREEVAWRVSILVVTDGPSGSLARFTTPQGDPGTALVPAFPRDRPLQDTNRAGEAFASTFISTLLSHEWEPASGVVAVNLVRKAMIRASAAAALVLDRSDFGFPAPEDVESALRAGKVA
jgi:sugar/nucleoside kinase (ribokinase family)